MFAELFKKPIAGVNVVRARPTGARSVSHIDSDPFLDFGLLNCLDVLDLLAVHEGFFPRIC